MNKLTTALIVLKTGACQIEHSKELENLVKELLAKISVNFKGAQRERVVVDNFR
jgi:hypothetical protein